MAQPSNLLRIAQNEYKKKEQVDAEFVRSRREEFTPMAREYFKEFFGIEPEEVNGWNISHEGYEFLVSKSRGHKIFSIQYLALCPDCGQEALTWKLNTPADFYEYTKEPAFENHYCKAKKANSESDLLLSMKGTLQEALRGYERHNGSYYEDCLMASGLVQAFGWVALVEAIEAGIFTTPEQY